MTLAWDSCWRERFTGRQREVLAGREKVIVSVDGVERLGTNIGVDVTSGEFVGLARLTTTVVAAMNRLCDVMGRPDHRRRHVSGIFELMR